MVDSDIDKKFEKKVAQKILATTQKITIGEAGKTGAWRSMRPVIDEKSCVVVKTGKPTCHFCWLYCPETTISRTIPPKINYDFCKGCGICAHECPSKAIRMIPEKEEPSCKDTDHSPQKQSKEPPSKDPIAVEP